MVEENARSKYINMTQPCMHSSPEQPEISSHGSEMQLQIRLCSLVPMSKVIQLAVKEELVQSSLCFQAWNEVDLSLQHNGG
ncbi:hypothetical protein HPP92_004204 [Vanilla planifolia]|uniref:Uncharacterized protein n=1 Tax=Vanilla planifolia TaxID=51239 RepID=A0A835VDR7_VANPL|nr:hypothetical protein HPP92_004652 [Vanilla planifolia]KAG0493210.1 hypothetical protein HPP92_004204 [Vanilla planifolia]